LISISKSAADASGGILSHKLSNILIAQLPTVLFDITKFILEGTNFITANKSLVINYNHVVNNIT